VEEIGMNKIRVLYIFEILGKPAEHIIASLEKMIDQLSEQKGLEVVRRDVREPKLVESETGASSDSKASETVKKVEPGLYSTFAEVEILTEDIKLVMAVVFNMLPAHTEILEPSEFKFSNSEMSSLMTELSVKMHKYDEITKVLILERNELLKRLNERDNMVRTMDMGDGEKDGK
jgi:hypothetical protein